MQPFHRSQNNRGNQRENQGNYVQLSDTEKLQKQEKRKERELDLKITSRVIAVDSVRKTTAAGRINNFRAAVVAGDGNGLGGFGVATAPTVKDAIRKAYARSKQHWVYLDMTEDKGLYFDVMGKHNSTRVLLRSCRPYSGITAGREVEAICQVMGLENTVSKVIGRRNSLAVINATFEAFGKHRTPEETSRLRGRKIIRCPKWFL